METNKTVNTVNANKEIKIPVNGIDIICNSGDQIRIDCNTGKITLFRLSKGNKKVIDIHKNLFKTIPQIPIKHHQIAVNTSGIDSFHDYGKEEKRPSKNNPEFGLFAMLQFEMESIENINYNVLSSSGIIYKWFMLGETKIIVDRNNTKRIRWIETPNNKNGVDITYTPDGFYSEPKTKPEDNTLTKEEKNAIEIFDRQMKKKTNSTGKVPGLKYTRS